MSDNGGASLAETEREQVTDLLNSLLQDGCLHIRVDLLVSVLLLQEGVDTCILHFLLRGRTRWVLRDLLHDFEHALQRMQHKSIRCIAEEDG